MGEHADRINDESVGDDSQADERLIHELAWDDPSALSMRQRKALCGAWITDRTAEADYRKKRAVTCPDCIRLHNEYDFNFL